VHWRRAAESQAQSGEGALRGELAAYEYADMLAAAGRMPGMAEDEFRLQR
jgi:hypothetical protein